MKTGRIYCLIDPFSYEVRYVGFTTKTLSDRFSCHKYEALKRKGPTYKDKWFRKCTKQGKLPIISLLEDNVPYDKWEEKENYHIGKYNNLTNIRAGGHGIVVDRIKSSVDSSNECRKKAIVQLNINGSFVKQHDSIRDAERELCFIRSSRIGVVCNKKAYSAYNYRWAFLEDYKKGELPIYVDKKQKYLNRKNGMSQKIMVINTLDPSDIKYYDSIIEFGKVISPNNIEPGKVFISKKTGLVQNKYKIIKI